MELREKTPDLLPRLQQFELFEGIAPEALQWLINRSDYRFYPEGSYLFQPDMPADHMMVILEGSYVVHIYRNGDLKEVGTWEAGYVTGLLPFSRMKETSAFGKALTNVFTLELHRECFVEMVNTSYELTQKLVALMSSRIREFSQLRFHDEKLMALGKLSAGLAHELNNPASAMVRSAEELYNKVHQTPERFKAVITLRITPEQTDEVNRILFSKIQQPLPDLSILDRQEALDDILDWLEDQGIDNGDDLAETFVDFGLNTDELEEILTILNSHGLETILWWIESTLSLERLVKEIRESSDRIAQLVSSVKKYSHMDRGSAKEFTDIRDGIINTLIILKHKLKIKNIQLVKEFDPELPKFKGFVGELNQVWTNLIANAIDAMDPGGLLKIVSYRERNSICVEVTDNGKGIPEDVQTRIFEPFFTTKGIGEGTGMGLDIVKRIVDRHKGDIRVKSSPGQTTFKVCLPIEPITVP